MKDLEYWLRAALGLHDHREGYGPYTHSFTTRKYCRPKWWCMVRRHDHYWEQFTYTIERKK